MNLTDDDFWLYAAVAAPDRQIQQAALLEQRSRHQIPWIHNTSGFFQYGSLQASILFISTALTVFSLVRRRNTRQVSRIRSKASAINWRYELWSQAARAASVAFLLVAAFEGRVHFLNAVVTAYGFVLGLLRLVNDLEWRHVALHQINFVFSAMLAVLVIAQFLPCIEIGARCSADMSTLGGIVALAVAFVVAVNTPREWLPPSISHGDTVPVTPSKLEPSPEETCSWFNYFCSYSWLTPVVWKGARRRLDMSGIPKLAWYDEPLYLLRKVQKIRSMSKKTFWTTLRFQKKELSSMAIWIAFAYSAENIAPYGMFKLLDYITNPSGALYQPWLWLFLVFVGPISRSLFFQQYVFTSTRLVVRIKSAMTQELYHRALGSMELEDDPFEQQQKSNATGRKGSARTQKTTTSAGRLANLMAADVEAVFKARDAVMVLIGVPLGTIVSCVGIYSMMGWPSLVGIFVLTSATPISLWFGRMMFRAQKIVRKAQDSRLSMVTEYLASIRAIKYFSWENAITKKIVDVRSQEQKQLWRVSMLQTSISQVTQVFPYLALMVMFGLHVGVEKKRLNASVAFTTVYLVKNIRRNIMQASYFARQFSGAMVAFGRLDKYFETTVPLVKYPVSPLRIEKGFFRRNKKATFRLEDVSLDFVEGGLNVVSGPSGSGKTTLLLAILGEVCLEGGFVTRPADVAFASQSAWLQNESVQANILFTSPMESARYSRVIEACCLNTDFKELSNGDMTVVGENGTSLSGGQKARVALARALYSKAPLLLLDDIFSALDAKTAAGVWEHCFCSDLLRGRTTVLVTQVPWIALQSDLAINLAQGRILSAEPNIGVIRKPITVAEVLGGNGNDSAESEPLPGSQQPSSDNTINGSGNSVGSAGSENIVDKEMKASGKVGRLTFLQYMRYFGHPLFAAVCIILLLLQNVVYFSGTYWISIWVEAYEHNAHVDIVYYLAIFGLLNLSDITMTAATAIMFEWGAWSAARKLHNDFIRAIMRVPLSWFKSIPIGRITNRFSGDISSIDGSLSSLLRNSIDIVIQMIFRLAAVSSIMPIFMVPALFTCVVGIVIGEMYTRTAVIIKRLTSSAQSPVFSQFADTLAGLPVIRARAGMSQAFGEELAAKLRVWAASAEANYNCNRWVAVRIDFVTALVALAAGSIAVSNAGLVSAGLVGFSLTNANSLSSCILMLVRWMNDLEVEMQSFHRVKEYVKLESEDKDDKPYPDEGTYSDDGSQVLPKNWPCSGEIEFRNVTIRYDADGPDVLKDINLKFKAGERVAIVGRTGSGKSTLVLSLLRFTHIVSGQILYDGIDITKVPRHRLREGLTIIPQEAVLFNGTIESNLDPSSTVPRVVLEKSLQNCRGIASFGNTGSNNESLANPDEHKGIQLSTEVDARGENFSHGQRQVLSLCRALIRQSKLMLLDEATASMDYETDRGIQKVLRDELEAMGGDGTLVTIAHRLKTIIDYDSVVVMSAGRVVEHGSPKELYDAKGLFHDMVCHSGEMAELQELLDE